MGKADHGHIARLAFSGITTLEEFQSRMSSTTKTKSHGNSWAAQIAYISCIFGIFTALFCCIMVVVFIVAIVDEHFMVKVFEVVAVVKVADAIIFCVML